MTVATPVELLRHRARALSAADAWPELCALFGNEDGAAPAGSDGLPGELVNLRAEALLRSGKALEARDWVSRLLPDIERRGDRAAIRQATNLLGAASFELGELAVAKSSFERALDLGQRDGDDLLVARATNNLGAIANVQGQREHALSMYAIATAAYQRLGQSRGLAAASHNMAITFRHLGLLDRADEYERRAIEFAREASNTHILAMARLGRAEISLLLGDARLADASATRLAGELAQRSDPIQQANALRLAGAARLALNDLDGAAAALDDGVRLARAHSAALIEAELLRTRAKLHCVRGETANARDDALRAIDLFDRLHALADRDELRDWLAALDRSAELHQDATPCVESRQSEA